jgi:hypothetical protein
MASWDTTGQKQRKLSMLSNGRQCSAALNKGFYYKQDTGETLYSRRPIDHSEWMFNEGGHAAAIDTFSALIAGHLGGEDQMDFSKGGTSQPR